MKVRICRKVFLYGIYPSESTLHKNIFYSFLWWWIKSIILVDLSYFYFIFTLISSGLAVCFFRSSSISIISSSRKHVFLLTTHKLSQTWPIVRQQHPAFLYFWSCVGMWILTLVVWLQVRDACVKNQSSPQFIYVPFTWLSLLTVILYYNEVTYGHQLYLLFCRKSECVCVIEDRKCFNMYMYYYLCILLVQALSEIDLVNK